MPTRTLTVALAFVVVTLSGATLTYGQDASASQPNVKPQVFVIDNQPGETHVSAGVSSPWGAQTSADAGLQAAEVIKTFAQKCPQVQINNKPDFADYVVELYNPGGKGTPHPKGRVVVFDRRSADPVGNKRALSMDELLQDACVLVIGQWGIHSSELIAMREIENVMAPPRQIEAGAGPEAAANNTANVSITSNPSGADIQIDGNYVGSTPSVVKLPPGTVLIKIQKKGFNSWERKLKISGGDVKVSADLDASAAPAK